MYSYRFKYSLVKRMPSCLLKSWIKFTILILSGIFLAFKGPSMYEKESESLLLDSRETVIQNSFVCDNPEDPIQQYNYVIHHYNFEENQINHTRLDLIQESTIYHQFWQVSSRPWLLFTMLALIIIPGIGFLIYIWLSIGILNYLYGLPIYNRNRTRISDPFQNMIFSPELCRITNSLNKFFDIKIRGKMR